MSSVKNLSFSLKCYIFILYTLCVELHNTYAEDERKEYIVYMGSVPEDEDYSPSSHHLSMLGKVLVGSVTPGESLVRSYGKSINGFAAKLSIQEKDALSDLDEVVSVFPTNEVILHTTRSWDFSGLHLDAPREKTVESDIIIGVLDSGIWPDSTSFNDEGLEPIPSKWKGPCEAQDFKCNRKIIGARVYKKNVSALDTYGHGTHVASTCAGTLVKDANMYGLAGGIARGAVPSARIAVYKCADLGEVEDSASTLMAAFDDAISDGVDILQVSIGSNDIIESFDTDLFAIVSFHAFMKGILMVQSAGNFGQKAFVRGVSPWSITVGASTTDRKLMAKLIVDKNMELSAIIGENIISTGEKDVPLVYGGSISLDSWKNKTEAGLCVKNSLNPDLGKGKILLCDQIDGILEVARVGALGIIYPSTGDVGPPPIFPLPSIQLSSDDYTKLLSHVKTQSSAQGRITKSISFNDSTAPVVATFSNRGPNPVAFDILKPDIVAPGVSILAATTPKSTSSYLQHLKYYILSGTSMSTPHVSGTAAYIKSFHPTWSPSAIKSAILTTARPMNRSRHPDAEFSYGAGFFDPIKALDPGLVYNTTVDDYIHFLCKLGYDSKKIKLIGGMSSASCTANSTDKGSPQDANIPSFTVEVKENKPFTINFTRTVTNVGTPKSTYTATVEKTSDSGLDVIVTPTILNFNSMNEQKSFTVTVTNKKGLKKGSIISNQLIWKSSDDKNRVRSPIIVYNYPDRHST